MKVSFPNMGNSWHSGEAGILKRVESFVKMVCWKKKKLTRDSKTQESMKT